MDKLISLNQDQINYLRNLDQTQRKEFLSSQPSVLDQGVKNLDFVAEKLQKWNA